MLTFLSTLSLRRATCSRRPPGCFRRFLSTLSLRRATIQPQRAVLVPPISIHALPMVHFLFLHPISIHALLAESDHFRGIPQFLNLAFLSTLSLRRATRKQQERRGNNGDFYPRSPCGERHKKANVAFRVVDFYPRSPCGERHPAPVPCGPNADISIHALLAESDAYYVASVGHRQHFYPRSPCGERRQAKVSVGVVLYGFLSTLSLRRATPAFSACCGMRKFLSTLSLRRATWHCPPRSMTITYFYPRSPCGERRKCKHLGIGYYSISIHALLAESDRPPRSTLTAATDFYPRSPCGERLMVVLLCHHISNFYPRSPCGERLLS